MYDDLAVAHMNESAMKLGIEISHLILFSAMSACTLGASRSAFCCWLFIVHILELLGFALRAEQSKAAAEQAKVAAEQALAVSFSF